MNNNNDNTDNNNAVAKKQSKLDIFNNIISKYMCRLIQFNTNWVEVYKIGCSAGP
jgi:hypothetical protein